MFKTFIAALVHTAVLCQAHPLVVEQPEQTPKPEIIPVKLAAEPVVEPVVEPEEDPEATDVGQDLVDKAGDIAD